MLRSIAGLSLETSDVSTIKPIVIHHLNDLTLGGTEKMVQIHLSHFVKDNTFNHYLAYRAQGDKAREEYFKEILNPISALIPNIIILLIIFLSTAAFHSTKEVKKYHLHWIYNLV